jgi:hypothetical protein
LQLADTAGLGFELEDLCESSSRSATESQGLQQHLSWPESWYLMGNENFQELQQPAQGLASRSNDLHFSYLNADPFPPIDLRDEGNCDSLRYLPDIGPAGPSNGIIFDATFTEPVRTEATPLDYSDFFNTGTAGNQYLEHPTRTKITHGDMSVPCANDQDFLSSGNGHLGLGHQAQYVGTIFDNL